MGMRIFELLFTIIVIFLFGVLLWKILNTIEAVIDDRKLRGLSEDEFSKALRERISLFLEEVLHSVVLDEETTKEGIYIQKLMKLETEENDKN